SALGKPTVNGTARNPVTFTGAPEHASSYNIPIPQGSTSATIQLGRHDWYEGPFIAKDFAIWAPGENIGVPLPTTVPSVSAAPTINPTVNPTVVPTVNLTPKPTVKPTPVPTPKPTVAPPPVISGSVIK